MSDAPRFTILRTQKLKHLGSVRRSLKHSFREQETPNADQSRASENTHIGAGSTAEAMDAVQSRLPEKRRKDAVLAVEYLVTASPEAMHSKSREEQDAYFADALEWLKERHGAENLVYAGIHRDETTPHLYAYAVPLDSQTGRLNAKKWLGGSKALSQMQTDFAERVGKHHGLERGIEGSRAKHQTVQRYYGNLEAASERRIEIPPEALKPQVVQKRLFTKNLETPEQVAWRITQGVNEEFTEVAAKASEFTQERRRRQELGVTLTHQQKRLQKLQEPFKGLSKDQVAEVIKVATRFQRSNELEKIQRREQRKDRSKGMER